MKNRKNAAVFLGGLAMCLLMGCGQKNTAPEQSVLTLLSACETAGGMEVEIGGRNLLLEKGVKITADSAESKDFSPGLAADGIRDADGLRWSSENNWENNEHWLQADLGKETEIGYVKIFWERTNACGYAVEYSADAKNWNTAVSFDTVPASKEQNICLETPVTARYLRLHVTDVTKEEADLSLYYQNVSVLELEVYGPVADRFVVETPQVQEKQLVLPAVPEGYQVSFGGADYENLITKEGRTAGVLSPVNVEVGLVLEKDGLTWELPGMDLLLEPEEDSREQKPPVELTEWAAGEGELVLPTQLQLAVAENGSEGAEKEQIQRVFVVTELFAEELQETGRFGAVEICDRQEGQQADIVLELTEESTNFLGEEGFEILVDKEGVRILGNTPQSIRWGCVTLLDWINSCSNEEIMLAAGRGRDYPRYSVRGFGIDVGRRAISLDLLYQMVEALSAARMNTLQIHVNDNQIIAQSPYDGTVEGARNLYAGFRLESDLRNEKGEGITSTDLYYTKEEFQELIERAAVYGVEIVPEIDTPAHSLCFTRVFPELGFSKDPESVDQLDLSKDKARQLGMTVWKEYLTAEGGEGSVFENCSALHLGMDEYYGKPENYVAYLQELSAYVGELAPEKELRIWGSLSKMDTDISGISGNLQMHVWDTDWSDPGDMYDAGFGIINSQGSSLYIIPGGGYDRLDVQQLAENWQPNVFVTEKRSWELPAWSERMLGACYMMWNDWSWSNEEQITEADLFDRFAEPLDVIAEKLWGISISF